MNDGTGGWGQNGSGGSGGGYGPPPAGGFGAPPAGGYGAPPPGGYGPNPYTAPGPMPVGQRTDPMASVAMALGLASVVGSFCCSFFGIPLSFAAVTVGLLSLSNINKRPLELTGRGMAITGIATGSLGIILLILMIVIGFGGSFLRHL